MKATAIVTALVAVLFCGVIALNYGFRPSRVPESEQEQRDRVQQRLEQMPAQIQEEQRTQEEQQAEQAAAPEPPSPETAQAPAPEDPIVPPVVNEPVWPETAPEVFRVRFECTNGVFIVECVKAWAPLGAQRFYTLVREGFYDNAGFFRVVPGFVVQFGLAADPDITAKWTGQRLQDDPVTESNAPGTITFATSGPDSRTTQVFINLGNNARLDDMGFAPFGRVVEGMDTVKAISAAHGEQPHQGMITREGTAYLKKNFPQLDYIERATLIP